MRGSWELRRYNGRSSGGLGNLWWEERLLTWKAGPGEEKWGCQHINCRAFPCEEGRTSLMKVAAW